ncbi:uncharacterized protein LOC106157435 [Lingula anatina]|uniref:Uncharacterized protein LOC106157435 n=1 Tax=Lingula anatina TaxID=7574 RepID=A0A1S3HTZ2_LINAN|nr:uncharacterized protein LOC106157435 [Lingula anatina]|eukprot:XP_013388524.1 uncharacterized protein LOC106157435 [Lingula anatina]
MSQSEGRAPLATDDSLHELDTDPSYSYLDDSIDTPNEAEGAYSVLQGDHNNYNNADEKTETESSVCESTCSGNDGVKIHVSDEEGDVQEGAKEKVQTRLSKEDQKLISDECPDVDDTSSESHAVADTYREESVTVKTKEPQAKLYTSQLKVNTKPIERPRSRTPINLVTLDEYVCSESPEKSPGLSKLNITLPGEEFETKEKISRKPKVATEKTWFNFNEANLFSHSKSAVIVNQLIKNGRDSQKKMLVPKTLNELKAEQSSALQENHSKHPQSAASLEESKQQNNPDVIGPTAQVVSPVSSGWEVFEEKSDLKSRSQKKHFLLSTPSFEAKLTEKQISGYNDALDPFMSQNTAGTQQGDLENHGLTDSPSTLSSELPGLQDQFVENSRTFAEDMPKKHKSSKKAAKGADDLSDIIANGPKPRGPGEFVPYEERIDEDSEEWQTFQQMQERIKRSVQKTQENIEKLAAKADSPDFLKPEPKVETVTSSLLGLTDSNMDEPELDLRLQVCAPPASNGTETESDLFSSLPASKAQAKSTDDLLGLSLPDSDVQPTQTQCDPFELDDDMLADQETSAGLSSIVDDFLGIDESALHQKPLKKPEEMLEELAQRNKPPPPHPTIPDELGFDQAPVSEAQQPINEDPFDLGFDIPTKTSNLDAFESPDQIGLVGMESNERLKPEPKSPIPRPSPGKSALRAKVDLSVAACILAAPIKASDRISSPPQNQGSPTKAQNGILDAEISTESLMTPENVVSGGSPSTTPTRGYSSDNPFRSASKSEDSAVGDEDQFAGFFDTVSNAQGVVTTSDIGFDPFSTIEPTGHDIQHEQGAVNSFDPFATIVGDDIIDGVGEQQKMEKCDFDPFTQVEENTPFSTPSPTKKQIEGVVAPPRLRDLKDILGESCADDVMPVEHVDDPFKTTEGIDDPSTANGNLDLFGEAAFSSENEGASASDPSFSPSATIPSPVDKDKATSSRFNPFNKTSPEDEVADETEKFECRDGSQELTPSPDADTDFEPLEDYFPSAEGKVWKLLLRQPGKKTKNLVNRLPGKLPGSTKRSWRNVWVKLVPGKDGKTLIRLHDSDKTDARAFQEVPLLPIYDFSGINLQQYDQYGKIHTVKLQQITFKERPGIKTEKLMTELTYPNFLERFRPKPTMVLDHQPVATELLKFGSLNYDEIRSFVWTCEDALLRTEAHREKTQIYNKDEVQVLAQDEYMAIVDKEGHIMSQKARARIFVLAFVTGMPPCELGLNDKRRKGKEVVGRKDIIPIKTDEWIAIQQYEFHSLVDLKEFEKTGLIKFYPLDGTQFELLRFRVKPKQNLQLPLQVQTQMTVNKKHVEIRADVMVPGYFTDSARSGEVPCENIMIRFPIPEPWIYYFREERLFKYGSLHSVKRKPGKIKGIERITALAQGFLPQSLMEASAGTAKYEHIFGAIVWRIDRLPGRTEGAYKTHLFTMKLDLGPHDPIPDSYKQYVDVEFTMPNTTISGTQVRSISVGNPNNPERWVKYVGKYEYKVEIDLKIEDEASPSQAPEDLDSCHSSED